MAPFLSLFSGTNLQSRCVQRRSPRIFFPIAASFSSHGPQGPRHRQHVFEVYASAAPASATPRNVSGRGRGGRCVSADILYMSEDNCVSYMNCVRQMTTIKGLLLVTWPWTKGLGVGLQYRIMFERKQQSRTIRSGDTAIALASRSLQSRRSARGVGVFDHSSHFSVQSGHVDTVGEWKAVSEGRVELVCTHEHQLPSHSSL